MDTLSAQSVFGTDRPYRSVAINGLFTLILGQPPSVMNFYFSQALKRAGLPPIRLHDARHSFATFMLELGESPKVVSTLLGHSSIKVTLDVYSHVSLELEKRAMAKLDQRVSVK